MNEPVRHHWVPRYYLRAFANAQGQLHVYDKTRGKSFTAAPENIAVERHFHTIDLPGMMPADPYELEKMLADQFEGPHSRAHCTILEHLNQRTGQLDPALKVTVAEMVALQLVRTPRIRQQMSEAAAKESGGLGVTYTQDELAKGAHLRLLNPAQNGTLDRMTSHLAAMSVRFLEVPAEAPIYTSDAPVLTGITDPTNGKMILTASQGIGRDGAELYFPLSSRFIVVLFGRHVALDDGKLQIMNAEYSTVFNRMIFTAAEDQIYASITVTPLPE